MRSIKRVIQAVSGKEGDGFSIRRPFPTAAAREIDPFLLLDEMGPADFGPGEAKGASDHPHRGFETVTIILAGEMEHADSSGQRGVLRAGDVQWMTAGRGVVHAEMPGTKIMRDGGRLHGFQLWVNLPRAKKMIEPRYQQISASAIAEHRCKDARVRVIAGSWQGLKGAAELQTPVTVLQIELEPGRSLDVPLNREWTAMAYVFAGGLENAADGTLVEYRPDGDSVRLDAGPSGAKLLLLAGQPLREPIARMGPFVMSTSGELNQAYDDYMTGRMGSIQRKEMRQ